MGPANPVSELWIQYDLSRVAQISSVVATTIATIASLVFSITIVALMSVASNFSIRYVINVFNHQMIRLILTIFIFTYCYALFFPVLNGKNEAVLAQKISFMFFLVLMCMGSLLFYIRYIIQAIQIDKICQYNSHRIIIELENEHVLLKERNYDQKVRPKTFQGKEYIITSKNNGFVNDVAYQKIYDISCRERFCSEVLVRSGDFLVEGSSIIAIKSTAHVSKKTKAALQKCIKINVHESFTNSVEKHLTQLVDIAIKSLSPGVNDTNSAITVINYITTILRHMFNLKRPRNYFLDEKGYKTLIVKPTSIDEIIKKTLDTIRFYASSNQPALCYLVKTLGHLLMFAKNKTQENLLKEQVAAIKEAIKVQQFQPHDAENLKKEIAAFRNIYQKKNKSGV